MALNFSEWNQQVPFYIPDLRNTNPLQRNLTITQFLTKFKLHLKKKKKKGLNAKKKPPRLSKDIPTWLLLVTYSTTEILLTTQ